MYNFHYQPRISTVLANEVAISILFTSQTFCPVIKVTKSTRVRAGHVACMKGLMNVHKTLFAKPQRKKPLEKTFE